MKTISKRNNEKSFTSEDNLQSPNIFYMKPRLSDSEFVEWKKYQCNIHILLLSWTRRKSLPKFLALNILFVYLVWVLLQYNY